MQNLLQEMSPKVFEGGRFETFRDHTVRSKTRRLGLQQHLAEMHAAAQLWLEALCKLLRLHRMPCCLLL